ncbi:T9SS sorting signal type C domain-containing protein [Flavobacterium sp. RSB2_4_14]|uniref:T9SS sorting signal type C domain-containing protein n=1 Tax=Flavobacterium sp. RSB2_4_14 TaxID=3447665 RepID=UPI003F2E4C78
MNTFFSDNNVKHPKWNNLVFFAVFILMLVTQFASSQVATYGFSESVTSYSPLSTPTPIVAYSAPWDDHVSGSAVLAPIGFTFRYDGVNQTDCYINPNGFISFGAVQPSPTTYLPLSTSTLFTSGGTVSALGMDLISNSTSSTDNIVYSTIGTAPNRIFVVQWSNARRKPMTGNFNFQIRLLETSNVIELSYGLCAPSNPSVFNAQVGIRGVSNDFLQGNINNRFQSGTNTNSTWFGRTVLGTANSNTVRTSITEYPNNGLKYSYTPSTNCLSPTGIPSNLLVGNSNVNSTSFVGNSFTPATTAPTNYLILRSTTNTPPTGLIIPNRTYWAVNDIISGVYTVISTSNATSFLQTSLSPNTTYYYWVIPYNAGCLSGPIYNLSSMITASKTTCITAPTGVIASSVQGNSFVASWNTVAGASDYQLDIATNSTFTATLPAYTNFSTGGAVSAILAGLNPLVTYYFRVRAVGISCSVNSSAVTVTTTCGAFPIPYFQNFDTTPVNSIPTCFTVTNSNSDSIVWQVQNSLAASTPNAIHLATNTVSDSNDWFFTPGLNLIIGVTYRLKFKYNTQGAGLFAENLKVRLGTGASEAEMNNTLLDFPNLINTVYQTAIVDFTPVTNEVFYLGFQGYSFSNQSKIVIDDISIIVSPTCFEPFNVAVASVGSTTVSISWEASIPPPAVGYQYYLSTSNTTPSDTVTPTGSVGAGVLTASITGLTPATLYYVWIRGDCSPIDKSVWSLVQSFSTDCSTSSLLTVINGTLCSGGTTTLVASSNPGSTIDWFSDASGTNLVGTGTNFVTPILFSNTTYYAQSKAPGGLILAGPSSPTDAGGSFGVLQTQTFITFSVTATTNLQSVDIYPMISGQNGVITIRNSSNAIIATYSYITNVAGGNTAQTISLNVDLDSGNYLLYMDSLPVGGLVVNIDNAIYPYTSSIANITGNGYDGTYYLYAYNWKFSNICRSLLTPVTATVSAAPVIVFSSSSETICSGETTGVVNVIGSSAYNVFNWSTTIGINGTISTGFTFNPTTTTVYSFTASQSAGSLCTSVISLTVTVRPLPPAITIVPSTVSICEGAVQTLTASLALSTPVTIYSENFNSSTNNWITVNSSIGGNVLATAWTLRQSPYNYTSTYWNLVNMRSNDNTQFYFSNSDASGSPGTNRTITQLISPSFNLAGYTTASLNFWHYLRYIGGNKSQVETSVDGGSTWTTLIVFNGTQGGFTSFVNATVSLNSLVGNSNVKIRFIYEATWDYGWAIDNVAITGNLALEVSWLPPTELYVDSAATIPYITGTPTATVYAKPNNTTTYTGSVVGSNGCSVSSTSTISVIPGVSLGLLSSSQTVCAGWAPLPLTLVGATGTIVRWEYATDSAFTTGLTAIANTTTTLIPTQIGTYIGDRYFRVVLQTGTCPVVYSNFVLVSFPSTTWDGTTWSNGSPTATTRAVFSGNFSSTFDINACSVEVLSGAVTINSAHTLTVQNDVKVTGGSLTFQNNASLVQVNSLNNVGVPFTNSGNITYNRTTTPILKFDYTYWSSPVSPQTLFNVSPLTPSDFYYEFNSSINNWQWVNSITAMTPGKGYIIRAPFNYNTSVPALYTAPFIGVPNTGTISIPVVGGGNQLNLLGNPYPSALSADALITDPSNSTTLSGTIYLWTHYTPITANNYTGSDYAVYNYMGGVGTGSAATSGASTIPNGKIASGQGFFIKGLNTGTATFKNSMRIAGNNNQFFRMASNTTSSVSEPEKHRYWLDIYNTSGAYKQVLIGYTDGATTSLDRLYDGEMVDVGNAITLYTMADNTKLSIQGRPMPFDVNEMLPLGFKSTSNGNYTIALTNFDGLFQTQNIYLEDTLLGLIHDLKAAAYTFTTVSGTFESRFILRYTNQTLGNNNSIFDENSVVVYKDLFGLNINTGSINMKNVKIFDMRGRLIAEKIQIGNTQTVFTNLPTTQQVLLIKIESENEKVVTKKIIY